MTSTRFLTPEQVRAVDRWAIEQLGVPGIVLMENAGRNAAEIIDQEMQRRGADAVMVVCGVGNNGGDGFVVARHLANRSRSVQTVLVGSAERMSKDCRINHDIVVKLGLPVISVTGPSEAARIDSLMSDQVYVVDALLGTGFSGVVREPLASVIARMNGGPHAGIAAIDIPSGLDGLTGEVEGAAVKADITVTFVAPKTGFQIHTALHYLGTVFVADIGIPTSVIERALGN